MADTQREMVVGVFSSPERAAAAVDELRSIGFGADKIGVAEHDLPAGEPEHGEAQELPTGTETKGFGGAVASFFGASGGSLSGALKGMGIDEKLASELEQQYQSGRSLVAVECSGRCLDASLILRRIGAEIEPDMPSGMSPNAFGAGVPGPEPGQGFGYGDSSGMDPSGTGNVRGADETTRYSNPADTGVTGPATEETRLEDAAKFAFEPLQRGYSPHEHSFVDEQCAICGLARPLDSEGRGYQARGGTESHVHHYVNGRCGCGQTEGTLG